MNRRRALLALVALCLVPLAAMGQQVGKIPRLCFLTFDPGTLQSTRFTPFFESLHKLGYVNGKTIIIDYLSAHGKAERFPAIAAECVRLKADVIAISTTPAAHAAKKATRTIPIVMLGLGDPVGAGLVKSLGYPGGNITGMTFMAPALAAKRVGLLKEAVPGISRVLVLTYSSDPISAPQIAAMKEAARLLKVTLYIHDIRGPEDLPIAFQAGVKEGAEGLLPTAESIFQVHRAEIAALAAKHKLPAIYSSQLFISEGGLMAYTANFPALHEGAAAFVDKILRGAKPVDLPVMQPTHFEFWINLQTAKALGLTIPGSILVRADKVVE